MSRSPSGGDPGRRECAVTETQAHGAAAIAYSAESVTIVAGETAAVTVTNSFSAPPVSSVPPTELPLTSLATTGGDSAGALFAAGWSGAVLIAGIELASRRRARTE